MSAPANTGPVVPEKNGVSKFLSRMKTVLRGKDKDGASKRKSIIGTKSTSGPSVSKPTEPTPVVEPVEEPKATEPETAGDATQPTKVPRSTIDADRARKLAERYNVALEPLFAGPEKRPDALRVEKPIRMRIHRSCHLCNTTFGSNKVCMKCQHVRCKSCPRFPLKKPEGKGKGTAKEGGAVIGGGIEPDTYYGLRREGGLVLTRPNPKTGGQPLVRKKPMQRVRRNCCGCQALFAAGGKVCEECEHVRCADCPRDPAKKSKYPDGYPGDAPSSNTSIPVKYTCHECTKAFPPVPHPASPEAANSPTLKCTRCNHEMCSDCPRASPMRVEPTHDPEVLKSVQAKLAALDISMGSGGVGSSGGKEKEKEKEMEVDTAGGSGGGE